MSKDKMFFVFIKIHLSIQNSFISNFLRGPPASQQEPQEKSLGEALPTPLQQRWHGSGELSPTDRWAIIRFTELLLTRKTVWSFGATVSTVHLSTSLAGLSISGG